jgi:hypothetical protein
MVHDQTEREETRPSESRRLFLKEGLAAMAGALLLGSPALARAFEVRVRAAEDAAEPAVGKPAGIARVARPEPKIPKPFLGERLEFDITFLGAKTASGLITFVKTGDNEYTAALVGTVGSLVGVVTAYRKISMTSVMTVKTHDGKERFVTKTFTRNTIKTSGATETRNELDYVRHRWVHSKYENGKKVGGRVRRIPPDVYYDDFVALLYNFRAQVYGPAKPGFRQTLTTLPWERKVNGKKAGKTATTIEVIAPTPEQLKDEDRKWLQAVGGDLLIVVKLDKDVYGIPSGEAKFAGAAGLIPAGAWVKDAVLFGDVQANRKKQDAPPPSGG